jgi:ferritin
MLKPEIQVALNQQINAEFYSAYLYLAMGAWLDGENFSGMGRWMKVQAQEELGHAMGFYKYIYERGGTVTLTAVAAPPVKWDSPLAVFTEAGRHESHVTDLINNLVDLAQAAKDHATENFLQSYVKEQVEEEATAADICRQLAMVGKSTSGLFFLNKHLGERKGGS